MLRCGLLGILCVAAAFCQDPVERLFTAAMEAQQRGDFATAAKDYAEVVRAQPDFFGAWANLGVALVRLGRFDEAIDAYRAALKLDRSNSSLCMNLALAFYKKGDWQGAATELEALVATDPRAVTLLGDCYVRLGKPERAAAVVEAPAHAHPEDLDLAYVLGSAWIATGRQKDGLALVERVARQRRSSEAYVLAAKTWLGIGDSERALRNLDEAMRISPGMAGLYTLRGVAREGVLDDQGAESDLRKALEANPNDFEATVHLGAILYARRDLAAARPYLDRALRLDPASAFAVYEMAVWKSASGDVDGAVRDLETVVRRDPNWLQAHVQLAALYYRVNRADDGAKERQIVDRISAEQQKAAASVRVP